MEYNKDSKQWVNTVTGKSIVLKSEDPRNGAKFSLAQGDNGQAKWDIITCSSIG